MAKVTVVLDSGLTYEVVTRPPVIITPPVPPTTGDDWQARRTAPGVFRSFDFADATQLGGNYRSAVGTEAGGATRPAIDTDIKDGACNTLRISTTQKSGENSGGYWLGNYSDDFSLRMGENSEHFVQVRTKWNDVMANFNFLMADGVHSPGMKLFDIVAGDTPTAHYDTSDALKCVLTTYSQYRFPILYGYWPDGYTFNYFEPVGSPPTDYKLENGPGMSCLYTKPGTGLTPNAGCFKIGTEWNTWLLRVKLGAKGFHTVQTLVNVPVWLDSEIQLFGKHDGAEPQLLIDWKPGIPGYRPLYRGPDASDRQFAKLILFPFLTGKSQTQEHPVGHTWYSKVLMSTKMPAWPGVAVEVPPVIVIPPVVIPPTTGLPAFVPPVGTIANYGVNRLKDLDPCPDRQCDAARGSGSGFQSTIECSNMIYAPLVGKYGSMVNLISGGHDGYYGDDVTGFDFDKGLFSKYLKPYSGCAIEAPAGHQYEKYRGHPLEGEMWKDANCIETRPDRPAASHGYFYAAHVPIGTMGTGFTMCRPAMSRIGGGHGRRSHTMNFAQQLLAGPDTSMWVRASVDRVPAGFGAAYGGACYDSKRHGVWGSDSTGALGGLIFFDLATSKYSPYYNKAEFVCFLGSTMYSKELDRIVWFSGRNNEFRVANPGNPNSRSFKPVMVGDIPPISLTHGNGGGADWCSDLPNGPGFAYYPGTGGQTIYICQPDGDPDLRWKWTAVVLTGVVPDIQYTTANPHNRFLYISPLRSFAYLAKIASPVQLFRAFA